MNQSKICKVCGIEKDVEKFRVNTRHCILCQYEKNNIYSKTYYQLHKARLLEMNKDNYVKNVRYYTLKRLDELKYMRLKLF